MVLWRSLLFDPLLEVFMNSFGNITPMIDVQPLMCSPESEATVFIRDRQSIDPVVLRPLLKGITVRGHECFDQLFDGISDFVVSYLVIDGQSKL